MQRSRRRMKKMKKKVPEMIWHQDNKILQQVIKQLLDSGEGNNINLITVGQVFLGEGDSSPSKMLEKILDLLPEPRMKNLVDMATNVALGKFKASRHAAGYLGVAERTMRYKEKALKEGKDG
jgi:hypothetical protein